MNNPERPNLDPRVQEAVSFYRHLAHPLEPNRAGFTAWDPDNRSLEPIINQAAAAQIVLISKANHGSQEFYQLASQLTLDLTTNHRFNLILLEMNWDDADKLIRHLPTI